MGNRAVDVSTAQPSQVTQRRRDQRRPVSPERFVMIDDGIRLHRITVHNASDHGLSGLCEAQTLEQRNYTFVFDNGERRIGQIRWKVDQRIGVYFAQALPPNLLSTRKADVLPRAQRFTVCRRAHVIMDDLQRPAIIRNVSVTGLLLEAVMTPSPGQRLSVQLPRLTLDCVVRWSRQSLTGAQFLQPIDLTVFDDASRYPPQEFVVDAAL